jgi:hypothetical protein
MEKEFSLVDRSAAEFECPVGKAWTFPPDYGDFAIRRFEDRMTTAYEIS